MSSGGAELELVAVEGATENFEELEYVNMANHPCNNARVWECIAFLMAFVVATVCMPKSVVYETTSIPLNFQSNVTAHFEHKVSTSEKLLNQVNISCVLKRDGNNTHNSPFSVNLKTMIVGGDGDFHVRKKSFSEFFNSTAPVMLESFEALTSTHGYHDIRIEMAITGNLNGYSSLEFITCFVSPKVEAFLYRTKMSVGVITVMTMIVSVVAKSWCKKNLISFIIVAMVWIVFNQPYWEIVLINAMRFFIQLHLHSAIGDTMKTLVHLGLSIVLAGVQIMVSYSREYLMTTRIIYFCVFVFCWYTKFKNRNEYNTAGYVWMLFGMTVIGISPVVCDILPLEPSRCKMIELSCIGVASVLMLKLLQTVNTKATNYEQIPTL